MLEHAIRKLHSERGASLSMALMLFLVCAVASSIVLVAATAAAGRQSLFQKMEKSYYNVSSAAKLFWDELNDPNGGGTVRVLRTCSKVSFNPDGSLVAEESAEYTAEIDGLIELGSNASLFQIVAYDLLFGSPTADHFDFGDSRNISSVDAKGSFSMGGILLPLEPSQRNVRQATYGSAGASTFAIKADDASGFDSVAVQTTRKSDGSLEFVFKEEGDSNSYICTLEVLLGSVTTEQMSRRNDDGTYAFTWETVLTWRPSYMYLGGGPA